MINRLFIKAIFIIIIVAFSIPAMLMIYHDFQITTEPEFDINHFSALFLFNSMKIEIDSQSGFNSLIS